LQEIDSFYQKLSELIEALELESGSKTIKPSSQHMIETLSDIQYDFEELMKHQKYNKSTYERLAKLLVEKPYNAPAEIVATALET
jgi:DNA replication initiation complex subunit (GINS family)